MSLIDPPPALTRLVADICARPVPDGLGPLITEVQNRFGDSLQAIILYGSCLRMQQLDDGVIDLYVIVRDYRSAYLTRILRLLNDWLPPNVFYIETPGPRVLRCKYAVLSNDDLYHGCRTWFHSYIWSRFAQPCRLLYCADTGLHTTLMENLAAATLTFLGQTLPVLADGMYTSETVWENGLGLTYAAELRPERHTRAREITRQNIADFVLLTRAAAPALALDPSPEGQFHVKTSLGQQRQFRYHWRLRRWQGVLLSVLRLMKAAFTFTNGVDYAAWKIERHTGTRIEVTPHMRRHPILFGFSVLWRLIRRDVMH